MKIKLTWEALDENKKKRRHTKTFNVALQEEDCFDWALLQARQLEIFDNLIDVQVDDDE